MIDRDLALGATHYRVLQSLARRWVKGTGFAHRSVGTDLIAAGLVDSRVHHGERQIRINDAGRAALTLVPGER